MTLTPLLFIISLMNERPEHEIGEAEKHYDVGDHKKAREIALKVKAEADRTDEDRQRAKRILEATQSDPVVVMAIVFTLFVFVFIVLKYAF